LAGKTLEEQGKKEINSAKKEKPSYGKDQRPRRTRAEQGEKNHFIVPKGDG